MATATGVSRARTSSSAIDATAASWRRGLLICVSLGVIAALFDMLVRMPLHLPGHRGLIGMGILVLARVSTRQPWSASATAATSALIVAAPVISARPSAAMLYLVSALVVDAACLLFATWRERVWFLALAAGLGNGAKAIALWLLGDRIAAGFGVQLASHIGFGLCGGLIAAQLWAVTRRSISLKPK
jgi:hypothetical protein